MVPCAFNQPTFRPELPAHSKHRYLSRSPTRWKAEAMYTVHDQEPHMLSSDSQWLDLICVGRWLVTCAPTAAVGAASSLSPLKSLDSMLTPCMQICSRRLNVVGARVEWRRVPNFPTQPAGWQLRSNLASTCIGWKPNSPASMHATYNGHFIQGNDHPMHWR